MGNPQTQITTLLDAVSNGDREAAERLWRAVYDELRVIAKGCLAQECQRGNLQTTVLVHEAYLRLVGNDGAAPPSNRRHFFAAAANAMRQFLVDDARKRRSLKRGKGRDPVPLEMEPPCMVYDPAEVLAIDEGLSKLRALSERRAEIVKLRYFGGLTVDETAEVLGISPRQVDREWQHARAWLHRALGCQPRPDK